MSSSIYDTTRIKIKADKYIFTLSGSTIKFDGFMRLYIEGKDDLKNDEDELKILPNLNVGDVLKKEDLIKEQKFTEPPARYTEASLVKVMEEKGIGRPSTYAPTISTLEERYYVEKEKKHIVPTELGIIVTE